MRNINAVFTLVLFLTSVLGDYTVFRSKYVTSPIIRAIVDNLVHATIGCLSAIIFFTHDMSMSRHACIYNVTICTLLSSLIDIDHFIVARSLHFKDLSGLKQQGIFHCTTLWLVFTATSFIYSYLCSKNNILVATFMIFIAFTSHHLRDANRRGFWIYPFGHTVPVPTYIYVILTMCLPNVYPHIYFYMKPLMYKHTVVNYNLVV